MKRWNKSGQFYLLAAIVIIAAIIGFATVSNYTQKQSSVKLYDLREELGIESAFVLDYGTFNVNNAQARKEITQNFSEDYIAYAGEGKNIYLIFGNKEDVYLVTYDEVSRGQISQVFEGTASSMDIIAHKINVTKLDIIPGESNTQKVIVPIGEPVINYEFNLKPGENFYFVISQEIGGEQHVVTS